MGGPTEKKRKTNPADPDKLGNLGDPSLRFSSCMLISCGLRINPFPNIFLVTCFPCWFNRQAVDPGGSGDWMHEFISQINTGLPAREIRTWGLPVSDLCTSKASKALLHWSLAVVPINAHICLTPGGSLIA